jgi:hypothetical protein
VRNLPRISSAEAAKSAVRTICDPDLRRTEYLFAVQSRHGHALPDLSFIPIGLCRVEMTKSRVQRCRIKRGVSDHGTP